jgi:hypothetical protein
MAENSGKFQVFAPLDPSGIKDFKPDRPPKVIAFFPSGEASCV